MTTLYCLDFFKNSKLNRGEVKIGYTANNGKLLRYPGEAINSGFTDSVELIELDYNENVTCTVKKISSMTSNLR